MVISIGSGRKKEPRNDFSSDLLMCCSAVYQRTGISVGRVSAYQRIRKEDEKKVFVTDFLSADLPR